MTTIIKTPQFAPQRGARWGYAWDAAIETLTATLTTVSLDADGLPQVAQQSDLFDFSALTADDIFAGVTTALPYSPIVNAERDATGELTLTVVNWYDDGQAPPDEIVEVV